jgi:hypothetical protein
MTVTQVQVIKRWAHVLNLGDDNLIHVTGALRIGEGRALHADLSNHGFEPASGRGGREEASNGEVWYRRYQPNPSEAPVNQDIETALLTIHAGGPNSNGLALWLKYADLTPHQRREYGARIKEAAAIERW